eukprot:PhM_4_TR3295/c0_g1_i1/m.62965
MRFYRDHLFVLLLLNLFPCSSFGWASPTDLVCSVKVPELDAVMKWTVIGPYLRIELTAAALENIEGAAGYVALGFSSTPFELSNVPETMLILGYASSDDVQPTCVTGWNYYVNNNTLGLSRGTQRPTAWDVSLNGTVLTFNLRVESLPTAVRPMDMIGDIIIGVHDTALSHTFKSRCVSGASTPPPPPTRLTRFDNFNWEVNDGRCCASYPCTDANGVELTRQPTAAPGTPTRTDTTACPVAISDFSSSNVICNTTQEYETAMAELRTCRELRCTCFGGVTIAADTCSSASLCSRLQCQRKKYECDQKVFKRLVSESVACLDDAEAYLNMGCVLGMCGVAGCEDSEYIDACEDVIAPNAQLRTVTRPSKPLSLFMLFIFVFIQLWY